MGVVVTIAVGVVVAGALVVRVAVGVTVALGMVVGVTVVGVAVVGVAVVGVTVVGVTVGITVAVGVGVAVAVGVAVIGATVVGEVTRTGMTPVWGSQPLRAIPTTVRRPATAMMASGRGSRRLSDRPRRMPGPSSSHMTLSVLACLDESRGGIADSRGHHPRWRRGLGGSLGGVGETQGKAAAGAGGRGARCDDVTRGRITAIGGQAGWPSSR